MATKTNPNKSNKKSSTATTKKERKDRATSINQRAYEILDAAQKKGYTKIDFASKAIAAYGKERLGDAYPRSPDDELEDRLEYLERVVSKMAWEDKCNRTPKQAKLLSEIVAEAGQSAYSRNFEELNKRLRDTGETRKVADTYWITAAFAGKFKFSTPEEKEEKKTDKPPRKGKPSA